MRLKGADKSNTARLIFFVAICIVPILASKARAEELPLVRDNFGGVGMIDMPTARMAPDGELSLSATYFQNTQRYDLGFQALPWLETDIRYSGLTHFILQPLYPVYWDRSFAAKARLVEENKYLPSIAIGINDLIGTGVYSGEYVVGSKRIGDLDFSLGVGWGRLGSAATFGNPLRGLSPSLDKPRPTVTNPGGTNFSVFFHGPNSGLFGGVVWNSPIKDLLLIAEYSSDAYVLERETGNFRPRAQLNFGASYRVTDSIALGLNWLYGRSIGGTVSFELDPTTETYPAKIGPPTPPIAVRSTKERQEALRQMLKPSSQIKAGSFHSTNQLVDKLWEQDRNIEDVAVEGDRLSLTVKGRNLAFVCHNTSRTVGFYDTRFKVIRVSDGPRKVVCPVEVFPEIATFRSNVPATFGRNTAHPSSDVLTIDASQSASADVSASIARIRIDAAKQRLVILAADLSGSEATIYFGNEQYFSEVDALNRLISLLTEDAPPQIEKFRLIAMGAGLPQREFDVLRAPTEREFVQEGRITAGNAFVSRPAPMQNPVLAAAEARNYPQLSWSIFPQFRQELFDPRNPLGVQLLAGAAGSVGLWPGFSLNGEVEASIWDNFNTNRPSNSVLPHVRTDFPLYFTKGKDGIGDLEADYLFRLSPEVFAVFKAGYLESMFAGVGGEILWRPEGQRWALGGDLYGVQQRDFDRLFGLQAYQAVTGHISLYYNSPWYGLNFVIRGGQYLAQDRGLTFEISRRFSTGVEIGAFFTKTNVPSSKFGEGSFDKGIVIRIPIDWALPVDTQAELSTVLRPVQRDGGQRLLGDAILYDETRQTSQAEMASILH